MFQEDHSRCEHAYGYCGEERDSNFRSREQKEQEASAGWAAGEAAGADYDGPKDEHLFAVSKHYRAEFNRAVDEVVKTRAYFAAQRKGA